MGGKSMKAMRDTTVDNENCNAAEVTSAVSILPGQSGGPRENQDGGVGVTDPAPKDLQEQSACIETPESSSNDKQAFFQDMIRSNLISDLSSGTFHPNPEIGTEKKDMAQIIVERLSVIEQILVQIFLLSDPEKLYLYQKLSSLQNNTADTLSLPLNLLGNQEEIQQAIVWIKTHLEKMDKNFEVEQDIYDQYIGYCRNASMKALSTSDFGNVMKQVYAEIRARRLGTRDCGTVSAEIKEDRTENHKTKLKTPSQSPKIPSATVVKDSAPEDSKLSDVENLTMENKTAAFSATKLNFANDMNADSENKDNLSQPLLGLPTTNTNDINCALGKDLDILSDNVAEVIENDCTNNKIIVNLLDKVQLNNEELNVKGADQVDNSNEVNPNQNDESQPNIFLPTRIPLEAFKGIIQITSFKRTTGRRTPRIQGRRNQKRYQRFRGRRFQPQSQRCHRRRYVSIQLEPVNCGTYWLNIESLLRNKRNEVADLIRVIEEKVKYFGHLEDTRLLELVAETVIKELLKLNLETIAEIIISRLENIRGARDQNCKENTSGARTPAEIAVQGGLPQRGQSTDEYSAEPIVTLPQQSNIEYVPNHQLLISNAENMLNVNTVDVNQQNNAFIDTRPENSSTSNLRFVQSYPDSETPMLTPETNPFFSYQTSQTMLNNNFLPPTYCSRPDGYFPPLNHGFLLSNNVPLPNNNLISSDNTFLLGNNADLNGFDNMNTSILNGALNPQNNIVEGTFPQPTPDFAAENYSSNFYHPNAPEKCYQVPNFHEYSQDVANFTQAPMETDCVFPNLPKETDQLLINQPLFEDPLASIASSELEPVNNITGGEMRFPDNNTCNDTNNTIDEYSNEQSILFDSNEQSFGPISDCQNTGAVMENEPFPVLSFDDLAMDSDDITDQMLPHNFVPDSNNFNVDDNSLGTLPGQIEENNVNESSFSTENINAYLKFLEEPLNQTDSLLELQAGDNDLFDDLFDNGDENSKHLPGEGAMNECTGYEESSALDNYSYGDDIDEQLNEYLGLN